MPAGIRRRRVASTNDHLQQATADVVADWISRGAVLFARHGLGEPAARRLTIAMIAALEGAFVLARALRDPEPSSPCARTRA